MRGEPQTDFDFDSLDSANAPRLTELFLFRQRALVESLIGSRLSVRELAARALAVGIVGGHWRLRGRRLSALARGLCLSRSAISRRIDLVRANVGLPARKRNSEKHAAPIGKTLEKSTKPR